MSAKTQSGHLPSARKPSVVGPQYSLNTRCKTRETGRGLERVFSVYSTA